MRWGAVQRCLQRGILEIHRHRALVAVQRHEQRPHGRRLRRFALIALPIAGRRILNLDHVRAEVAQGLRRIRPKHELRQVDHPNAVQRSGLGFTLGHGNGSLR